MSIFRLFKHRMYLSVAWSDTSMSKSYTPQIGKIILSVLAVLGLTVVYDTYKKQQRNDVAF